MSDNIMEGAGVL